MKPVIGILGGMGPRATVQFEQMLLQRMGGSDQALPTIVTINDGSIPDRTNYLLHGGPDPVPAMQRNLSSLERCGAAIICLPCNTACLPQIFNRLQPQRSQLLNLPEIVSRYIADRGLKKVYLLATSGTVTAGTYQRLCGQNNVICIEPGQSIQNLVSSIIAAVKRGNMSTAMVLAGRVANVIAKTDCDAVILGCTELPLIGGSLVPTGRLTIDTLAVLADTCLQQVRSRQHKGDHYDTRPIHA